MGAKHWVHKHIKMEPTDTGDYWGGAGGREPRIENLPINIGCYPHLHGWQNQSYPNSQHYTHVTCICTPWVWNKSWYYFLKLLQINLVNIALGWVWSFRRWRIYSRQQGALWKAEKPEGHQVFQPTGLHACVCECMRACVVCVCVRLALSLNSKQTVWIRQI